MTKTKNIDISIINSHDICDNTVFSDINSLELSELLDPIIQNCAKHEYDNNAVGITEENIKQIENWTANKKAKNKLAKIDKIKKELAIIIDVYSRIKTIDSELQIKINENNVNDYVIICPDNKYYLFDNVTSEIINHEKSFNDSIEYVYVRKSQIK